MTHNNLEEPIELWEDSIEEWENGWLGTDIEHARKSPIERKEAVKKALSKAKNTTHVKLTIGIEKDTVGYCVVFPDIPGCYSAGETHEECLMNIQDAIDTHLSPGDIIFVRSIDEYRKNPEFKNMNLKEVEVKLPFGVKSCLH